MSALLEVRGLQVGYGHVSVLEGVTLEVRAGTLVALVGSNGAGKSTLLRSISGLLRPTMGTIIFDGKPLNNASPASIVASGLLHVAEGRRLFRSQTVLDNLELGLYGSRLSRGESAERFERIYQLFPALHEKRSARAGILSGGQQQMLAVAQALMRSPRLIMLDEPSLGLAPVIIDQLLEAVVELRNQGTTILLVEQMVERALQIADYAYVLQNGKLIGQGTARELKDGDLIRRAYMGDAIAF
jgi:branched-chain amino acid transport system ATP-binding protein